MTPSRLWHDAATQKAHVFLRLERKLLELSLVILGYFLGILIAADLFFLRIAAIYTNSTPASLLRRLARGKSSATAFKLT